MLKQITAQEIIDRIRIQNSSTWKNSTVDVLNTGNPDMTITGIATTFTPSIEVMQKAVATGKNMIISQQPAYYRDNHTKADDESVEEILKNDSTYLFKKDYIEKNNLVIWRFYENWIARETDGQILGLANALGWDKYHIKNSGKNEYEKGNRYFKIPEDTLGNTAHNFEKKLNIKGLRVIGDPSTIIHKASITNGMFKLSDLQMILKDDDVDLVVIAEAIEWESCEYFRDLLTCGKKKGMIILGREASEDPGYGEVANWLKTFITEVPVEWISAHEPFWLPE